MLNATPSFAIFPRECFDTTDFLERAYLTPSQFPTYKTFPSHQGTTRLPMIHEGDISSVADF
jgi:hypothetical protein